MTPSSVPDVPTLVLSGTEDAAESLFPSQMTPLKGHLSPGEGHLSPTLGHLATWRVSSGIQVGTSGMHKIGYLPLSWISGTSLISAHPFRYVQLALAETSEDQPIRMMKQEQEANGFEVQFLNV